METIYKRLECWVGHNASGHTSTVGGERIEVMTVSGRSALPLQMSCANNNTCRPSPKNATISSDVSCLRYGRSRSMNLQQAFIRSPIPTPTRLLTMSTLLRGNQTAGLTGRKYFKRDKANQAHLTRHARVFGEATWYSQCLGIIGAGSEGCLRGLRRGWNPFWIFR